VPLHFPPKPRLLYHQMPRYEHDPIRQHAFMMTGHDVYVFVSYSLDYIYWYDRIRDLSRKGHWETWAL
jgi:hypothetical protein